MRTLARLFSGFAVGWMIYMVAMVVTVYDGVLSLIFQPFMAVVCSGIFVGFAFVVGLVLRAPKVREMWARLGWWALLISVASVTVMIFSSKLGLESEGLNPDTKQMVRIMSPLATVICYFFAIFPVVNLPRRERRNNFPQPAPATGRG